MAAAAAAVRARLRAAMCFVTMGSGQLDSGAVPRLLHPIKLQIRGFCDGKEDPEGEVKMFMLQLEAFLTKSELSMDTYTFGELVRKIACLTSYAAKKNGVLYPVELDNLLATFIPIRGTYEVYNSRVVIVDLINKMDTLEHKAHLKSRVTTAVIGACIAIPAALCQSAAWELLGILWAWELLGRP